MGSKFATACLRVVVAVALLAFAGAGELWAQQGTVTGRVTAAQTNEPLAGATVLVVGSARGSVTAEDGGYRITLAPGVYTIRVALLGYAATSQQVRVVADQTATLNFALETRAILIDEIVAVGSRTTRTALETPVPVDVVPSLEIRQSGEPEVNQILRAIVPSFHASHQTIADGTDHVNPASLRGLGPDQTLVLINGKRRHQSALVHVNGTFGRGTVGVDLNSIPTAAIERIEVLRDGAAAQYGSDAIAGVINIVLKEQSDFVEFNGMAGVTGEGDGGVGKADVNYGFEIGERGFFNITGEFMERGRTDRSETFTDRVFVSDSVADEAAIAASGLTRDDFTMKTGQAEATFAGVFFNTMVPLSEAAEFYAFGGITKRDGEATGFYRLPIAEKRVVFELFPNGFLPEIHTDIDDGSFTAGLSGSHSGWDLDLSVTHGSNSFLFNIENSNNASLGVASPITFDAGTLNFRQTTGNFDAVRLLSTDGALRSLSLVLGGEFRVENYEIEAGEEASYVLGPVETAAGESKEPGSQVFPGFQPDNEVDRDRNSISAYAGLESQVTDQLLVDVGGRYENYSDFGSTLTGKIAARFEVAPQFALRGAVSNGFRAPSLHQTWFNNVSIQFVTDPATGELEPQRVLTANNLDGVTQAFGIPELQEETSVNISAGFTAQPLPNLSVTADFYRITIDDRIVLTSRFEGGTSSVGMQIASILEPFAAQAVGAAIFFANAVDTETNGVDVVATYGTDVGNGRLTLTGSANLTKTDVERVNTPQALADQFAAGDQEAVRDLIFNREERNRLEDALPRSSGSLQARYRIDRFDLMGRASHYGNVRYRHPANPDNDETFGAKTLFDLELGYDILPGVKIVAGGTNIFNTFPDEHDEDKGNRSSGRFVYSRRVTQFGTNGGFYYGRLQLNL